MYISVVVPCYNEEKNIPLFYSAVKKQLGDFWTDIELIFINDGSSDETLRELKKIRNIDNGNVKIISFSRNFGKEAALLAGLEKSIGKYVCIIDADLQQNPKYIVQMVEFLESNSEYDMVSAYQKNRRESKWLIFLKGCFYNLINKISEVEFVKSASDFRTIKRNVVDEILRLEERCRFSKGIFSWVGFETYYMEYDVEDRASGNSKWSFWKLFKYAINGIISFSTVPLIISSLMGMFFCLISLLYMVIIVSKTIIYGEDVAGFPTIACLILFTSGFQLFFIGILGQYLARTFTETKKRPIYIIKEYID